MKTWHVIDAVVTADAREAAEYGLMEAGACGTETVAGTNSRVNVLAYFDSANEIQAVRAELVEALRIYGCQPASLVELKTREIADADWLAEWKKHWQPVEVGRFIIAPPWSEPVAAAGGTNTDRIVIRINPGMAFGTGTHETTRLCLRAIEKYFSGGSFIDVGTGTGILAIAAAKLAPNAEIVACDTDAEASTIARENARANDVEQRIDFRVSTIDESMSSADVVCANLTVPVIVELLPSLLSTTCGRLILSGILDSQFEIVHARLIELAATVNEIMQDNEWLALVI
ncbi:MAG TPA: 50S ribosomal protein L11 methyltransferase [Pyrinomonadaceae bacterium]